MKHKGFSLTTIKKLVKWGKISLFTLLALLFALLIFDRGWAASGDLDLYNIIFTNSTQTALAELVGIIAVVMIIIAGIVYAFDLGGGKQIGLAKDIIISTISGLILFILASWLLTEINSLVPPINSPGADSSSNNGSPTNQQNNIDNSLGGGGNNPPISPGGGGGGYIPPSPPGFTPPVP